MRWRSVVLDTLIAVGAFAISARVLATSNDDELRSPDVIAYILLALYSGSIVLRRRAPIVAVFGGLLAGLAYAAADYPLALTPVILLAIYSAAASLPTRQARLLLVGAVLVSVVGATLSPGPTDVGVPALVFSAWLLGNYVSSRRAYTTELEHQNELLAKAQRELAERAVTEERLRIARELHDVVAHTLSVIAVHAGTGRMVAQDDPDAARQALGTIEVATRSAMQEMRQLLGVLRRSETDEADTRAPAPGLRDLDALVAEVVKSGVTVDVRVEGARPAVPAGVDLSAYRIIQEALTNVIKHAGRTSAHVAIRYGQDAVIVVVDDEGPGRGEPAPVPVARDGGHGLAGMRERVAIYDGDLTVGPRPAGGYHVAARLPFRAGE